MAVCSPLVAKSGPTGAKHVARSQLDRYVLFLIQSVIINAKSTVVINALLLNNVGLHLTASCITFVHAHQRRLIKRRETVRLSCTKQMGSARSSMRTTHHFHCPPETLIYYDLTVNLVGGANVVCFVSLLIHIAIHTSL